MKQRVALLMLFVVGTVWFAWSTLYRPPVGSVPIVATAHLHPLVAETIRSAITTVNEQPRSAAHWGELGMVLIAHGFRPQARECLEQAARLDSTDFQWPYFIGYTFEESDFDAALMHYERSLAIRPEYIPLRLRIARIQMRIGDLPRCRYMLLDGQRFEPRNPYVLVMLGRLAMLQNDPLSAEAFFDQAANEPGWMPHAAYLELIKLANRREDHALAYQYQQQLALMPETGKLEVPDRALQRILQFEGLSKTLAERGDLAIARGDMPAAILAYETFLRKRSDLPTPYVNLAQAYALSGEYNRAIEIYERVLNQFGDLVTAHMGLAATYGMAGQGALAMEQYRSVLQIKPNHVQAWFLLGVLQEQQGQPAIAIQSYQEAAAADPTFPWAQLAIGVALLKQERFSEARTHIARAVSLAPGDPTPLGYLQQVDEKLSSVTRRAQSQTTDVQTDQ